MSGKKGFNGAVGFGIPSNSTIDHAPKGFLIQTVIFFNTKGIFLTRLFEIKLIGNGDKIKSQRRFSPDFLRILPREIKEVKVLDFLFCETYICRIIYSKIRILFSNKHIGSCFSCVRVGEGGIFFYSRKI